MQTENEQERSMHGGEKEIWGSPQIVHMQTKQLDIGKL